MCVCARARAGVGCFLCVFPSLSEAHHPFQSSVPLCRVIPILSSSRSLHTGKANPSLVVETLSGFSHHTLWVVGNTCSPSDQLTSKEFTREVKPGSVCDPPLLSGPPFLLPHPEFTPGIGPVLHNQARVTARCDGWIKRRRVALRLVRNPRLCL